MTRKERRQFAMLLRVRDFGDTHGDRFSASSAAQATFAAVNAAIDTLIATDVMKMSASVSKRSDRKATARRAFTTPVLPRL